MMDKKISNRIAVLAAMAIAFAGGYATKAWTDNLPAAKSQGQITYNAPDLLHPCPFLSLAPFQWTSFDPLLVPTRLESSLFSGPMSKPSVEIQHDGKQVQVLVSEMKPEEVQINLQGNKLVIEGHHKQQTSNGYEEKNFTQAIELPQYTKPASIEKKVVQGKLVISIGGKTLADISPATN